MTLEQKLKEIKERAGKASDAPWYPNPEPLTNRSDIVNDYKKIGTAIENLDHLFISYARQDIPMLVEMVEVMKEKLEKIIEVSGTSCEHYHLAKDALEKCDKIVEGE